MRESRLGRMSTLLVLALVSTVFVAPIAWMVASSLKPQEEVTTADFSLLPKEPSADALKKLQ